MKRLYATILVVIVGMGPLFAQNSSTGTIRGSVVDTMTGQAISTATVTLSKWGPSGKWDYQWTVIERKQNDNQGWFVFSAVPATTDWERYQVEVSKSGYSFATSNQITLKASDTVTLDFRLKRLSGAILSRPRLSTPSLSIESRGGVIGIGYDGEPPIRVLTASLTGRIVAATVLSKSTPSASIRPASGWYVVRTDDQRSQATTSTSVFTLR